MIDSWYFVPFFCLTLWLLFTHQNNSWMKFAVCVLTALWREWDVAGRNPVCRKSCLMECHQCWGSLGRSVLSSCLELQPSVSARAKGPRQRLREAAWRSLQDTFPMAGAWQSEEENRKFVCAQPSAGLAAGLLWAWSTQTPWVKPPSASQQWCRGSCLLFLSC